MTDTDLHGDRDAIYRRATNTLNAMTDLGYKLTEADSNRIIEDVVTGNCRIDRVAPETEVRVRTTALYNTLQTIPGTIALYRTIATVAVGLLNNHEPIKLRATDTHIAHLTNQLAQYTPDQIRYEAPSLIAVWYGHLTDDIDTLAGHLDTGNEQPELEALRQGGFVNTTTITPAAHRHLRTLLASTTDDYDAAETAIAWANLVRNPPTTSALIRIVLNDHHGQTVKPSTITRHVLSAFDYYDHNHTSWPHHEEHLTALLTPNTHDAWALRSATDTWLKTFTGFCEALRTRRNTSVNDMGTDAVHEAIARGLIPPVQGTRSLVTRINTATAQHQSNPYQNNPRAAAEYAVLALYKYIDENTEYRAGETPEPGPDTCDPGRCPSIPCTECSIHNEWAEDHGEQDQEPEPVVNDAPAISGWLPTAPRPGGLAGQPLPEWWVETAEADLRRILPKAHEYSSSDLLMMGRMTAQMLGWGDATDAQCIEVACIWYATSKLTRALGAYSERREPDIDSLLDAASYIAMGRRARECGEWPGPVN